MSKKMSTQVQHLILIICIILIGNSCYYDNEEELYPSNGGCNDENVTYEAVVLPIIETNCYRCHDAQNNLGNVTLEGYDNVKTYVDNDRLLGAIRRESGFSPMPQDGPQLSSCLIDQIEAWVADGALDN